MIHAASKRFEAELGRALTSAEYEEFSWNFIKNLKDPDAE